MQAASNTTAEHRRAAESSKAAESGVLNKLAGKVAGSASQASMQMRSFGYGGSVKVSGSLSVVTVSMSIEVEIEEGEGQMLSERRKSVVAPPVAAADDDDDDEADAAAAAAAKVEEDVDPAVPDTPEKESRFKRQLGKAMKAAMMKVKVLAFHMRMSSLTGAIGIAVAMTFFGVGITLEFEITLASAITDVEFEDMKAREEAKKVM